MAASPAKANPKSAYVVTAMWAIGMGSLNDIPSRMREGTQPEALSKSFLLKLSYSPTLGQISG